MIEQSRKADIEVAIAIGYAGRIENPADLREDERKVNAEAAWDALGM